MLQNGYGGGVCAQENGGSAADTAIVVIVIANRITMGVMITHSLYGCGVGCISHQVLCM
ncbi:hypothetical protein Hanom_Chr05g00424521 [Helianthus anomalus]